MFSAYQCDGFGKLNWPIATTIIREVILNACHISSYVNKKKKLLNACAPISVSRFRIVGRYIKWTSIVCVKRR